MVKVGFICEGDTEKIIVESNSFKAFLNGNNLQFVKALDATGNGNLLPKNITPFINILLEEGVEKIFILTDLDDDLCITKTKERINAPSNINVIIAVKKIESWFLADSTLLSSIFKESFSVEYFENELNPRQILKDLFLKKTNRGIGDSKPLFAKRMINNGFSISNAALNPNCHSARYFISKLLSIK